MIQLMIVYAIIAIAVTYVLVSVARSLRRKATSDCNSGCDGCSGCNIKNELTKNVTHPDSKKTTCGCH